MRSLTASIASSSVPASSSVARHPTPAAAIRGVQWSALDCFGSAPSLTSVFRNGTSALIAASRNGVAPVRFRTPRPDAPRPEPRVDVRPVLDELLDELEAGQIPRADGGGIATLVVAPVRLADPGECMQRRESRSLIVRVGPRLEQVDSQLEMTILDGQDQR